LIAQQIVNGLSLGSIYAMVAVALTLSIAVINFLNFSIPGLFMVGGIAVWLVTRTGASWPSAFIVALAMGGVLALLVERLTWSWLQRSDPFVPLVSSMGFLILFENGVVALWGSDLKTLPAIFVSDLNIAGLVVSVPQLAGLAISLALVLVLWLMLKHTSSGRAFRTIAEDAEVASILGVNVGRMVVVLFVAGGVFAALAGALFAASYRQVHPFMGEVVGLKGISAMVVGGMGNVWGAILGGLLVGLTEVVAIALFGADFVDMAVYGLLLTILALKPTGLLGTALVGKGRV
jgi:branched-chain amino acid transport system permease protein